jgi:hypothetical protein
VPRGVESWYRAEIGLTVTNLIETYLGASSGLDGNDAKVARMVVSLNKSR